MVFFFREKKVFETTQQDHRKLKENCPANTVPSLADQGTGMITCFRNCACSLTQHQNHKNMSSTVSGQPLISNFLQDDRMCLRSVVPQGMQDSRVLSRTFRVSLLMNRVTSRHLQMLANKPCHPYKSVLVCPRSMVCGLFYGELGKDKMFSTYQNSILVYL